MKTSGNTLEEGALVQCLRHAERVGAGSLARWSVVSEGDVRECVQDNLFVGIIRKGEDEAGKVSRGTSEGTR